MRGSSKNMSTLIYFAANHSRAHAHIRNCFFRFFHLVARPPLFVSSFAFMNWFAEVKATSKCIFTNLPASAEIGAPRREILCTSAFAHSTRRIEVLLSIPFLIFHLFDAIFARTNSFVAHAVASATSSAVRCSWLASEYAI